MGSAVPPFFPDLSACHVAKQNPAPKGSRWGGTAPPFFPDLSELSRRVNGRQPSGATPLSPWRLWGEFEAFCCRAPTFAPALYPDALLPSGFPASGGDSREMPLLLPFYAFAFLG